MTPTPLILAGLALLAPQAPESQPASRPSRPGTPLEAYRGFPDARKQTLVRGLLRRVQLEPDPRIQRVVSMQRSLAKLPLEKPRVAHDPTVWARGVAPPRKLVLVNTDAHDALRRKVPAVRFLPELRRCVRYDWQRGQVVRRAQELTPDEIIWNLWHGYPPGSDWAVARILARLNSDEKHRKVGAYLDHLYADLSANVYEDVTIYEAWCSGQKIAVPDVDAIPFAVQILRDRSFRSPIPAGPRREWLYGRIRDHALAFRFHRTLIEAAAAAFVALDPAVHSDHQKLLPRFHYLFAAHDDDIDRVARLVTAVKNPRQRERFLADVTAEMEGDRAAWQLYQQRKRELRHMAARLRYLTARAIQRASDW